METEYHEIEFDSKDCTASSTGDLYPSDVTPNFFISNPLKKVVAVKVIEAQIPFSYYVINGNNNTFFLTERYEISGVPYVNANFVTIPAGNYDSSSILSALGDALTTASATAEIEPKVAQARTYTVSYSSLTMRLSIVSDNAAGESFQILDIRNLIDFNLLDQTCLKYLGIARDNAVAADASYYYQASDTGPFSFMELTEVLNLSGPNYIYLCSNKLAGSMDVHLPNNGLVFAVSGAYSGPQICKIPMTTDVGTVTNWQDPHPEKWFTFGGDDIQGNIDFYCTLGTDNWLYPIDFNGVGFSFKLGVLTASGEIGENYQSSLGQPTTKRVQTLIPMSF